MNDYTGYLLVGYGVTALVVIGNVIAARLQFRRTHQRLQGQLERRAGRRAVPDSPDPDRIAGNDGNEATVGRGS